jgi:hypothetical protein
MNDVASSPYIRRRIVVVNRIDKITDIRQHG